MKKLFSPIKIGKMEIKNRIVMPAMHLGYAENGFVSERMIRFYTERAKGGAGLIIVGGAYIHPLGMGGINFLALDEDRYIPKLMALTDSIHKNGAKAAIQLFHAGRYGYSFIIGDRPVAPSEVRSPLSGETPRALSQEEVKELIISFREAARRAKDAGFDAVELSGATGYLISQFLSPFTNRRRDIYGGSLENRMRFPLEIIQAIKGETGKDYPLFFRLSFDDLVDGGNGLKDAKGIAKGLEKGGVDALVMQVGWHESRVPTIAMLVPRGAFAYLAREIKREIKIPVVVTNRINDPILADELLEDGYGDMVGMGRPLIADPELPKKALEGRLDEIRPCIACNQGCFDSVLQGRPVTCLVNPRAGREDEFEIRPAPRPKKVAVIGAGPAGLESAIVLSKRGHQVTLFEKERRIGGKLNLCHLPPGRDEFKGYLKYMEGELKRSNVEVMTAVKVTEDTILKEDFDAIVVATGSEPLRPKIPGMERPNVYNAEAVLQGKAKLGKRVTVIGGGAVGCETALFIAKKGGISPSGAIFLMTTGVLPPEEALKITAGEREITIVEMLERIGADLGRSYRWIMVQRLRNHGVKMMTRTECLEIMERGVLVSMDGKKDVIDADTVVVATGYKKIDDLYRKLQGKVTELFRIGDAVEPRKCIEAIYEGAKSALEI